MKINVELSFRRNFKWKMEYLLTIFAKRINLSGITIQLRIALFDNLKSFILFNLLYMPLKYLRCELIGKVSCLETKKFTTCLKFSNTIAKRINCRTPALELRDNPRGKKPRGKNPTESERKPTAAQFLLIRA